MVNSGTSFISANKEGHPLLSLYVQPKASRTGFQTIHDNSLKLTITAQPLEGKANKAVIAYLASFFKIAKKSIVIKSGSQSRKKLVILKGLSLDEVEDKLREFI